MYPDTRRQQAYPTPPYNQPRTRLTPAPWPHILQTPAKPSVIHSLAVSITVLPLIMLVSTSPILPPGSVPWCFCLHRKAVLSRKCWTTQMKTRCCTPTTTRHGQPSSLYTGSPIPSIPHGYMKWKMSSSKTLVIFLNSYDNTLFVCWIWVSYTCLL